MSKSRESSKITPSHLIHLWSPFFFCLLFLRCKTSSLSSSKKLKFLHHLPDNSLDVSLYHWHVVVPSPVDDVHAYVVNEGWKFHVELCSILHLPWFFLFLGPGVRRIRSKSQLILLSPFSPMELSISSRLPLSAPGGVHLYPHQGMIFPRSKRPSQDS